MGNAYTVPLHLDVFRHGMLRFRTDSFEVSINAYQSPGQIRPFAESNCWVHLPAGLAQIQDGDMVRCMSLVSGQSLLEDATRCS